MMQSAENIAVDETVSQEPARSEIDYFVVRLRNLT